MDERDYKAMNKNQPCVSQCCCNCKNQIELFKHPLNRKYKGAVTEKTGLYACILPLDMSSKHQGIIFEEKHGECELHVYNQPTHEKRGN